MQQIEIDCATGQTITTALSAAEQAALASAATLAQQQAQQDAAAAAFRRQQMDALAGCSAALHAPPALVSADAAALSGLVHKLVADPLQPLSAPEMGVLTRFVLRCLLP